MCEFSLSRSKSFDVRNKKKKIARYGDKARCGTTCVGDDLSRKAR